MFDQAYQLYEINTFMVPVESDKPQATIIMDYIDLLAVNEEQNNYFGVTRTFLDEYCNGRTVLKCNYLFTSHNMTNSPSCASVMYQNKLEEIRKLCHIGFLEINSNCAPVIYDLQNSSILVINPARKMTYARCIDNYNNKKAEITDSALATVNLSCFYFVFNE